jgi:hypothetical protein
MPTIGVRLAERYPLGEFLLLGAVDVDPELVARLRVEPGLGVEAVDFGVNSSTQTVLPLPGRLTGRR